MSTIMNQYPNAPLPETLTRKHVLSDGGEATLTLKVMPDCVIGNVGTTIQFPPGPHPIAEPDMLSADTKAEAIFRELHPDHVCTDACNKHWQQMFSVLGAVPVPSGRVN